MVMDVRSGMRATLLAITFLWVGTSLPHIYSSTRAFFLESLPSILTAAMDPKCLFVFSNIIVIILVGESKLSRRRSKPLNTDNVTPATENGMLPERKEVEEVTAVTEALLPTFTGQTIQEQENNVVMVVNEDKGSSVFTQGLQMVDQCQDEVDHLYRHEVFEVQRQVKDGRAEIELMLGEEFREEEQGHAAIQELQETDLPTADELNRRVEDFIARFNMERQLEAKMLVPCY
ncbi:hypothetical protein QOZ80_5BG0437730 [Eleusine coracana subsp. coracana]|nr:hypothetical protein QOZ80_5BG0437730 [Eleusine coracana subsp. coracana]